MNSNEREKMIFVDGWARQVATRPIPGGDVGVSAAKRTRLGLYLTARDAYAMRTADPAVLLVDIRPSAEVAVRGAPAVADANIPYLTPASEALATPRSREEFDLQFILSIEGLLGARGLGRDTVVILICRAGGAAARAADLLCLAGFHKIYTVVDGFEGDRAHCGGRRGERVVNGWKNSGLPWLFPSHAQPRCHCNCH